MEEKVAFKSYLCFSIHLENYEHIGVKTCKLKKRMISLEKHENAVLLRVTRRNLAKMCNEMTKQSTFHGSI